MIEAKKKCRICGSNMRDVYKWKTSRMRKFRFLAFCAECGASSWYTCSKTPEIAMYHSPSIPRDELVVLRGEAFNQARKFGLGSALDIACRADDFFEVTADDLD